MFFFGHGSITRWPNVGKRGREREVGNAYQLGGLSFDNELLLLQILRVQNNVSMRPPR